MNLTPWPVNLTAELVAGLCDADNPRRAAHPAAPVLLALPPADPMPGMVRIGDRFVEVSLCSACAEAAPCPRHQTGSWLGTARPPGGRA